MRAAIHVMTIGISGRRRRTAVSVSLPDTSSDSVGQLDRVVEIFHQINRTLPRTVLDREELISVGGLLTQINGALMTLADLLSAPTQHYDRTRVQREATDTTPAEQPAATSLLRDCRDGYLAAYTSARAFHADIKRCPRAAPDTARRDQATRIDPADSTAPATA